MPVKYKGQPLPEIVSRSLSLILRHQAARFGIRMRRDAYARIGDVLRCSWLHRMVDEDWVVNFVESPPPGHKPRFELGTDRRGERLVRCLQGHSIEVHDEYLHTPVTLSNAPPLAMHGTYLELHDDIMEAGLKPGGQASDRSHVHFSTSYDGMRSDATMAIHLKVKSALNAGIAFWRSANDVLLTRATISPHLFDAIENLDTGEILEGP